MFTCTVISCSRTKIYLDLYFISTKLMYTSNIVEEG